MSLPQFKKISIDQYKPGKSGSSRKIKIYKLSANESALGPSPRAIKAYLKNKNFLNKYPDSDYALDLSFKRELIINQIAAKELYIARHYIKKQKWIAAINRLKNIVNDYETTVYIEEALHRLVEIHYKIGLEDEARKYAKTLGYNYETSEWYEESYRIFNKKYKNVRNSKKENRKRNLTGNLSKNHLDFENKRFEIDYDIDGLVYKVNNLDLFQKNKN